MAATKKERLLYGIDDILRNKATGEYHSHTFADSLYITEKTYRRLSKEKKLSYYLPGSRRTSQEMIEIYISNNGVSVSTYNYYLPISELSVRELQTIHDTIRKECSE